MNEQPSESAEGPSIPFGDDLRREFQAAVETLDYPQLAAVVSKYKELGVSQNDAWKLISPFAGDDDDDPRSELVMCILDAISGNCNKVFWLYD